MIEVRALVRNGGGRQEVRLETNGRVHELAVPPRPDGRGSSVNGGELLFFALATCYVNDVYREAARRGVEVTSILVQARGQFAEAPGSPAEGISYDATVEGAAPEAELLALLRATDELAEIHNTLRRGTPVILARAAAIDTRAR